MSNITSDECENHNGSQARVSVEGCRIKAWPGEGGKSAVQWWDVTPVQDDMSALISRMADIILTDGEAWLDSGETCGRA